MTRYEFALSSLPNSGLVKLVGPLYVLNDHFSLAYKKKPIKPDGTRGYAAYANRHTRNIAEQEQRERQRLTGRV
jgi:hypothetical protein